MDEANKTISIYFLCKFGLSNRIAKTLCGKRVELIDFFVRNNHGLFNKISKNKIDRISAVYFIYRLSVEIRTLVVLPQRFNSILARRFQGRVSTEDYARTNCHQQRCNRR